MFHPNKSLPTSKTAAAVAAQNVIVAKNVENLLAGKKLDDSYQGYTSCPLVTSKSTVMLAEFGYDGKVMESFHFDQGQRELNCSKNLIFLFKPKT